MRTRIVTAYDRGRGGWFVIAEAGNEYGEAGPFRSQGSARNRALAEAFRLSATSSSVELTVAGRVVELREVR